MKMTWFAHDPMGFIEANNLIAIYEKKGIKATKTITPDLKQFHVHALLPESEHEPVPSRRWAQPIWSRI